MEFNLGDLEVLAYVTKGEWYITPAVIYTNVDGVKSFCLNWIHFSLSFFWGS